MYNFVFICNGFYLNSNSCFFFNSVTSVSINISQCFYGQVFKMMINKNVLNIKRPMGLHLKQPKQILASKILVNETTALSSGVILVLLTNI